MGDAKRSLGDTKSSLGAAKSSLGDANAEFDFYYLVREHRLMEFLAAHLAPGEVDDDIILEVPLHPAVMCRSLGVSACGLFTQWSGESASVPPRRGLLILHYTPRW